MVPLFSDFPLASFITEMEIYFRFSVRFFMAERRPKKIIMQKMEASIVITTKNRMDELRQALASCMTQIACCEVIVVDDGSTDGSTDMVRSEFPGVRLIAHTDSAGYIVRRNEGARIAKAPIVFSIDDDALFSSPHVVKQVLGNFDDPKVGAVAIPYIEPHKGNTVQQQAPDDGRRWITDRYIGTSHALRKDLFLQLGGYRANYVHQGEEGDYCLRMIEAGYVILLSRSDLIVHTESPKRNLSRMDYYGRRNDILFTWQNIPLPYIVWRLPVVMAGGIVFGIRCGRPAIMIRGIFDGLKAMRTAPRKPVSAKTFLLQRALRKRGPQPFQDFW